MEVHLKTVKKYLLYRLVFLACAGIFISVQQAASQSPSAELNILRAKQACFESLSAPACDKSVLTPGELELLSSKADIDKAKKARITSLGLSSGAVSFFEAGVREVKDDLLKLRNGSTWQVRGYISSISRFEDAIVVMRSKESATIFLDGRVHNANLLFGSYTTQSGILDTVVREVGDGAVLTLESGGMLEVDSYDTYDTGWWLPPYPVIIDGTGMWMWNLDEGKKVWVNVVR